MRDPACPFCAIAAGEDTAILVYEDDVALAFLDKRPVFPGHTLLAPRQHISTFGELDPTLLHHLASTAQTLAVAVEKAMGADGTFIALNNKVSQSVPHVHVHVVPRRKKDGLRGFFWPRTRYRDDEEAAAVARKIGSEIASIKEGRG